MRAYLTEAGTRQLQRADHPADSECVTNMAAAAAGGEPAALWLALGSVAILLFLVTVVRLAVKGTTMPPSRRAYLRFSVIAYVGWGVVCFAHAAL